MSASFTLDTVCGQVVAKKIYFSLSIPSLASLYLFEQCLRLVVMSTSSVCLPL